MVDDERTNVPVLLVVPLWDVVSVQLPLVPIGETEFVKGPVTVAVPSLDRLSELLNVIDHEWICCSVGVSSPD